jgi:hypothetical protein
MVPHFTCNIIRIKFHMQESVQSLSPLPALRLLTPRAYLLPLFVLRSHPMLRLFLRAIALAIAVVVARNVPRFAPSMGGVPTISVAHDRIVPETVKNAERLEPQIAPASFLARLPMLAAPDLAPARLSLLCGDRWDEAPSRICRNVGHPRTMRCIHRMESDDPPRG